MPVAQLASNHHHLFPTPELYAMDSFSWSDGIRAALGPCLPCLQGRIQLDEDDPHSQRIPRARPDELEGLLAEVGDTDSDADALSLHSNFGAGNGRRRRSKTKKQIGNKLKGMRVWGWDLFGRPSVRLEESDGEREERRSRRSATTSSSTTLDSDAAPLDASAIEQLSSPNPAHPPQNVFPVGLSDAQLAAEETAQREAEERAARRERRRQRREMKRAGAALALGVDETEFEGFPGSGTGAPARPLMPFHHGSGSVSSHSVSSQGLSSQGRRPAHSPNLAPQEEFGAFVDGQADADAGAGANGPPEGEADEELDFGAENYTRRARPNASSQGSDSRSRTSASQSQGGYPHPHPHPNPNPGPYSDYQYQHMHISNPYAHATQGEPLSPSAVPLPSSPSPFGPADSAAAKKKKSKKGTSTSKSKSKSKSASSASASASTSQSPSLPSPVQTSFADIGIVSPGTPATQDGTAFEGVAFGAEDQAQAQAQDRDRDQGHPVTPRGEFPAVGFGGQRRKGGEMGAFLATRGD